MKRLAFIGLLALVVTAPVGAQKEIDRLTNSATVLKEILGMPDSIPKDLLDRAECVITASHRRICRIGLRNESSALTR